MKPDPRLYQIATLASLLAYGLIRLDFEIPLVQAASMLGTALVTQFACTRLWRLPAFDPRSALISGLSLCLLLRTNSLALSIAAAIVTVGSKFVIRINGKHLFNPTNFGIVAMMLADRTQVWVSPGQWGNVAFFAFLMACLGGLVVNRAARSDVTFAFIAFYMCARLRPVALARRAAGDSAASPRERRAAALHLLHDLGSEDDAGLARGTRCCSRCWSRSARGTSSSGCSAPTGCSGRWPFARSRCRSSIGSCRGRGTNGRVPQLGRLTPNGGDT